jgi:mannose/fructose/N-acetylgalactosamine-specific phosphotransferase system component IIC
MTRTTKILHIIGVVTTAFTCAVLGDIALGPRQGEPFGLVAMFIYGAFAFSPTPAVPAVVGTALVIAHFSAERRGWDTTGIALFAIIVLLAIAFGEFHRRRNRELQRG